MFPSAPIRLSRMATGLSALAILLAVPAAFAQATADIQVPFNLGSITLNGPEGVAVAPNGTVYAADAPAGGPGEKGRVIEIVPSAAGTVGGAAGGTASLNTATVTSLALPGALTRPSAVAVDSLGDLYVADYAAGSLYEMAAGGTTFTELTAYANTGADPTALATDSSNDLYVADGSWIYIFTGNATGPVANAAPRLLDLAGAYAPVGLAVNSAGDVLFASAGTQNHIYKYVPSSAVLTEYLADPTTTETFHFSTTVANTPGLPVGMGFDPAGRLFVLDSYSTTSGGTTTDYAHLWQIAATPSDTTTYPVAFSAATTLPGSLAVSSIGNLYISDDSGTTGVDEMFYNNNPANLGTVVAGTKAPLLNLNFDVYSADAPITEYQTMTGDYTAEFSLPTYTGTCNGDLGICNLQVETVYQSSTPGLRNGVIGYIDADTPPHVIAAHIVGSSGASSVALYPGTQTKLSTMVYEPQGEAVTGNGNTFFIADEGGINLNSATPTYPNPALDIFSGTTGVPAGTLGTVGNATELPSPMAAAVDAFGNLYVADYSGVVYEFPPTYNTGTGATSWSGKGTEILGTPTLTHPMSLAVDIYNNLYIGDMGSGGVNATQTNPGYIVKVPGNGGPATEFKYVIGGVPVVFPSGLIADSYGNLFIADTGDDITNFGSVDVVAASTGKATGLSITGNNLSPNTLNEPDYVALDAANDLYILDSYNERILTAPLTYSSSFVPSIANTGKIALFGALNSTKAAASVNSGLSALTTPTSLVIWPNQNTLTVSDIGYQPAGGGGNSFAPVQVLTLSSLDASVTLSALGDSASLVGINVGSESIAFGTPVSNNDTYSLTGCGNGNTLETGVTSACTATVDSTTTGPGGSGTITLPPSGNVISVTGPTSVPPSGTACNGTYSGVFNGNVTVSAGQDCVFTSGGVTGNVTENGGNLTLTQSQVGGNVQVNSGTFTIGPGSSIGGNLQIQGLLSGSAQNQVCGTTVQGNLQFQNNGTAVLIGSTDPVSCAGNTVGGNLQVQNNSGATTVTGNTVNGNLQDNNNTGPTQVFNNMIGNDLQCQQNSSISGGGNTAASKQGQCAAF